MPQPPTNNPEQLKATFENKKTRKQEKPPHHHTAPHHVITFKAVQSNLGRNMEDDLNIFENGRRPQFV